MVHTGSKTKNLNRDKITDAAIAAFAVNPEATVAEIAEAAGIVRRTVYGHFPTRHDLIIGIVERAAQELIDALPSPEDIPDEPDVALALLELCNWPVGDRYRALLGVGRRELGDQRILDMISGARQLTLDVVERGQARALFNRRVTADTIVAVSEAASLALLDDTHRVDGTITATIAADIALSLAGVDTARRADAIRSAEIIWNGISTTDS
ncbi:TetR/AcrR family transcriptional regulator [Rhodococcus sp. IEGM 1354]|uniref:TetR/AcrR family transcriptional regulator n=1 Tax=Rhodococcus sp. IEGM 1354 TaxID=3047088 RepID=UPI0024B7A635|nr:TetR/AcrR family transcriptional regulator [Rhodococcus sp. IEGM 1354]MDI9930719.1 TetR/AcrR family transcriptional regulator [Rhodococcus sp. IEGM 1354]